MAPSLRVAFIPSPPLIRTFTSSHLHTCAISTSGFCPNTRFLESCLHALRSVGALRF